MKLKEIEKNENLKKQIGEIYFNKDLKWDDRMKQLCELLGKSERTIRRNLVKLGFKEKADSGIVESDQYNTAKLKSHNKTSKYYLVSWAQNNTPVLAPFLENMKKYAQFLNGEILIIAGRYKNPTSVFTDAKEDFWCDEILPYLTANIHQLNTNIKVAGNIKISPTAQNPLQSMESLSDGETCIFGHPRVHLDTMATLSGHKLLLTTGACTKENYTDSKAGHVGCFNHTIGFCLIEVKDSKLFFVRQVTADSKTGNFTDLYHRVENQKVSRVESAECLVYGDIHVENCDPKIISQTEKLLLNKIKIKSLIFHDVFDGESISHHQEKNPYILAEKEFKNTNSLSNEISNMLKWLEKFENHDGDVVIVRSNHDLFIEKFLIGDWRLNIKNSKEFMKYGLAILNGETPNGVIPYIISQRFPNFKCLGLSDSYIVKGGFECGQHGSIGANGSRPTLSTFRRLVSKTITAHTHTPRRLDGSISCGTSTYLRLKYNEGGPSSWANCHVLVNSDGRAQHIFFINGEFTTFE